jgi:hypothetical protein
MVLPETEMLARLLSPKLQVYSAEAAEKITS